MRAGCGVGAGRAGRASTPFHAGTARPGTRAHAAHATAGRESCACGAVRLYTVFKFFCDSSSHPPPQLKDCPSLMPTVSIDNRLD